MVAWSHGRPYPGRGQVRLGRTGGRRRRHEFGCPGRPGARGMRGTEQGARRRTGPRQRQRHRATRHRARLLALPAACCVLRAALGSRQGTKAALSPRWLRWLRHRDGGELDRKHMNGRARWRRRRLIAGCHVGLPVLPVLVIDGGAASDIGVQRGARCWKASCHASRSLACSHGTLVRSRSR